jgi:hypothetical protein
MAEVTLTVAKATQGRVRGRRRRLDARLAVAKTGRQVLAAATDYFRATLADVGDEKAYRIAKEMIEWADREGEGKR